MEEIELNDYNCWAITALEVSFFAFLPSDLLHTEPIQIEADIPEMFMVIERGSIKYNLPSN